MKPAKRIKISQGRRGPFSNDEKKKMAEFYPLKSINEIALILNRTPKQIEKYCAEFLVNKAAPAKRTEDEEIRIELYSQADWKLIQKEYTKEEVNFYEIEYIDYRKQFKELTKTEIKQLHQLIMLDIKLHRHNANLMKDAEDIDRMERLLTRLVKENQGSSTNLSNPNVAMIAQLETQIQACRTTTTARQKEGNELVGKHSDLLVKLKSTRDQRIKNVEERGKFIVLLKELEDEARRNEISEIVGLMDLSVENTKKDLSKLYKYADGMADRPLLTPESIEQEEVEVETSM